MKHSEFAEIVSIEFKVSKEEVLEIIKNKDYKKLYNIISKKDFLIFTKKVFSKETITLTFGDVAENHKGMEQIGTLSEHGFSKKDLLFAKKQFENEGFACNLVDLSRDFYKKDDAYLLIIRKGVAIFTDCEKLYNEMTSFDWDKKAKMYGRVVNKYARHNVCFSENSQDPNYEEGKGTIISYDDVPLLRYVKDNLEKYVGEKAKNLKCEGNRYYDVDKCGIGQHSDLERRKVIATRLGASMKLCYQWYLNNERVGEKFSFILNDGDMYIMSEKAVGTDGRSRKEYILRHSAGCKKYTD